MPSDAERTAFARRYLQSLQGILNAIPLEDFVKVMGRLEDALREKKQVFLAGNGGSAATASHMANDLMKTVAKKHGNGMRVIALSDNVPLLTAIGNDEGYDEIFSGQLLALGNEGDVLIVISGSGNSPNLLRAVEEAKRMGMITIGFLGMDGGKLTSMTDVAVVVPSNDYGPIEDVHMIFNHLITAYLS